VIARGHVLRLGAEDIVGDIKVTIRKVIQLKIRMLFWRAKSRPRSCRRCGRPNVVSRDRVAILNADDDTPDCGLNIAWRF
jgi:hypothetical protein